MLSTSFLLVALIGADPTEIPLWPTDGPVPESVGAPAKNRPTVTLYLPAADKANGIAQRGTGVHRQSDPLAFAIQPPQGQKQRRRTTRHGDGVAAGKVQEPAKFIFKCRNLGALCKPPAGQHAARG